MMVIFVLTARKILPVLIMLIYSISGLAQKRDIIPPSPNSASLGQYGDVPVSNYTGIPNISIPLYTIKSGEIELPISLSYHSSGIKVAQEASWVGLGWALNAGGAISRQIRGLDDFGEYGYVRTGEIPSAYVLNKVALVMNIPSDRLNEEPTFEFTRLYPEIYEKCERAASGTFDPEPDIFYYNFFGHSGKLVFNKQTGQLIHGTSVVQNNLSFVYNVPEQTWLVTDGDGWEYHFGTAEITRSLSSEDFSPTLQGAVPSGTLSFDMKTAWYLDLVKTPQGDEVTFQYNRTGQWIESQINYDQIATRKSGLKVNGAPGFAFSEYGGSKFSAHVTFTDEVILSRINFSNGHLFFEPHFERRKDRKLSTIPAGTNRNDPFLRRVIAYDKDGLESKRVEFRHSYFRQDMINAENRESYLRLKLDYVQEMYPAKNGGYVSLPAYVFTYNETPLPKKTSSSADHWGYYNGADNTSIKSYKFVDLEHGGSVVHNALSTSHELLIPRLNYVNDNPNVKLCINGANREPNPKFAAAGALTEIRYPTGGVTVFDYELNDYFHLDEPLFDEKEIQLETTSLGVQERTFTLDRSTFIFVDFKLENHYYGGGSDPDVMNKMIAVLEKADGTNVLKFIPSDDQIDGEPGGSNNVDKMDASICVLLAPGTYRIKTDHVGHLYLSMSMAIRYTRQTPSKKKLAAGLRIKSITNFDRPDGEFISRKVYEYMEGDRSSGKLLSDVQYFYNETEMIYHLMNGEPYVRDCCGISSIINKRTAFPTHDIKTMSGSVIPLGSSAQGNPVGYDWVTVRNVDESGNSLGKTTFNYKNYKDYAPAIFVPGISQRVYPENGQVIGETYWNAAGKLVKERVYDYTKNEDTQLHLGAMKVYRWPNDWPFTGNSYSMPASELPVFVGYYDIYSSWWYNSKVIERVYDENSENPITTTTNFEYANPAHKQVTKTTMTTSRGELLEVLTAYSPDRPVGTRMTEDDFDDMVTRNILNPVLKQERRINGLFIGGFINRYGMSEHHSVVLKEIIEIEPRGLNLVTKVNVDRYDENGRVLQQTDANGIVTSYIWAYNGELPVVKGINVDYNILKTATELAAGTTNLENFWESLGIVDEMNYVWNDFNLTLRTQSTLQEAMITTFTYTPLMGMTSATDEASRTSYFIYDDFRRLKEVRNKDGHPLKKIEYVYAFD